MSNKLDQADQCLCGSGSVLSQCCRQYLDGGKAAPTAESLMRSRYVAYVLNDEAYLHRTWHPDTCPAPSDLSASLDDGGKWIGLKIVRTEAGGVNDEEGSVEFVARYKISGKAQRLHEISRFVRYGGCWVYVDGEAGC